MANSHPLVDLFRSREVNRLSEFASAAARIRTADIRSAYAVEVSSAPRRHVKGKTYFVGHTGSPSSGASSNRKEEHLAIALWHLFRTSGLLLPNGEQVVLIDYQVPLKACRADAGIGKIDLFGAVAPAVGKIGELKTGRDTPLKAILESIAYRAIAEANLPDLSVELGRTQTHLDCIVLAPAEYWDFYINKASAGNWVAEITSLCKRLKLDLGIEVSLLSLENCKWTMGLNGAAPRLSCAPTVRYAL